MSMALPNIPVILHNLDLLINLVIVPIGFIMLVVIRERAYRIVFAPAPRRKQQKGKRYAARGAINLQ